MSEPSNPKLRGEIAGLTAQLECVTAELAASASVASEHYHSWMKVSEEIAAVKAALHASEQETDAANRDVAAVQAEATEARKNISDLEYKLYAAEQALTLRDHVHERIPYVLSNGDAGAVSASLFHSIRGSAPAMFYAGPYQPPQDAEGRTFVDCDPKVWLAIVAFARCGAIPQGQQPELLAQARVWNIETLVQSLEARIPGVAHFQHHGNGTGFTTRVNFTNVLDDSTRKVRVASPGGEALSVMLNTRGVFCVFEGVNDSPSSFVPVKRGFTLRLLLKERTLTKVEPGHIVKHATAGWGFTWPMWGHSRDQILSEPDARSAGCVVVELQMNKEDYLPIEDTKKAA